MKRGKQKFQSIKINFPEKLYLALSWLSVDGNLMLYPHVQVYQTPNMAIKESKIILKGLQQNDYKPENILTLFTLEFIEKIPLHMEYWENPTFKYKHGDRFRTFMNFLKFKKDYKILVAAGDTDKNILTAPIPFLKNTTAEDVEIFMKSSDWPVDQRSDAFAFYKYRQYANIDVFTKKIYDKELPKTEVDKLLRN